MRKPTENLLYNILCRAYSRANKNRNLYDNQTFQKAILLNIDENIRNYNTLLPFDLQNTSYIIKDIPKTFHRLEPPDKELMIEQQMSRIRK